MDLVGEGRKEPSVSQPRDAIGTLARWTSVNSRSVELNDDVMYEKQSWSAVVKGELGE